MATQTTINTAAPKTYLNKTYYDKRLLEFAKTKFVFAKFGQKRPIPEHSGKKVEFRRFDTFDPNLVIGGLTEGVTPESQSLAQGYVEAEVKGYGAWVEVSDVLKRTSYDEVMKNSSQLLGEQLGTAADWVTRDVLNSGTNVQFVNGKTARDALTAADVLTVDEIRKAVRTLKSNKARMFTGSGRRPHYICIVGPFATYDLQTDPLWQDVSKYSNAEQIYNGELGRLFGVVFVESTEAKVFEGAGAGSADVHTSIIFGENAYGVVDIGGSTGAIQTYINDLGSAGTADPLHQRASVGAKIEAYAAVILNDSWIVRIEHGVTA